MLLPPMQYLCCCLLSQSFCLGAERAMEKWSQETSALLRPRWRRLQTSTLSTVDLGYRPSGLRNMKGCTYSSLMISQSSLSGNAELTLQCCPSLQLWQGDIGLLRTSGGTKKWGNGTSPSISQSFPSKSNLHLMVWASGYFFKRNS